MARPPSYDRDTVLLAAEDQFRKTGYAGTSLDDICAATGLGRGSLYGGFGDKHDIFLMTLDAYCERTTATGTQLLSGPDSSALDRLRDFLLGQACPDANPLGCMASKFALELDQVDEEAAARIATAFTGLQTLLVECVQAAQRHGDLDPDVDPGEIACMILTLSRGIDVVARGGISPDELTAAVNRSFAGLPFTKKWRRADAARRQREAALN